MHGADGRTGGRGGKGADDRADGGGKGANSRADGQKRHGQGPGGADRAQHARTGGRVDGRTGRSGPPLRGRWVGQTGRSGAEEPWSSELGGRADGESDGRADGRTGERADKRVGLGLKDHIPQGWVYSWAPSPLASLERKCAGCLGVQWGPVRFHVKHPYLAPGLICLV